MIPIEKVREGFEAWAKSEHVSLELIVPGHPGSQYKSPKTFDYWVAWQAALSLPSGGGQQESGTLSTAPSESSASEHTPGPWVAKETVGFRVYTEAKPGYLIATPGYFRESNQEEANARLIAAAPDLLAALQSMLAEKEDYMRRNNLGDPNKERTNIMANAAISKVSASNARSTGGASHG